MYWGQLQLELSTGSFMLSLAKKLDKENKIKKSL